MIVLEHGASHLLPRVALLGNVPVAWHIVVHRVIDLTVRHLDPSVTNATNNPVHQPELVGAWFVQHDLNG